MSRAPILQVTQLSLDAPGGRPLLRDLSLTLASERVALIGRNGVGKSTLLEVLAGERPAQRGRIACSAQRLLVPQQLSGASESSPGERRLRALVAARGCRPGLLLLDEPTRDLDAPGVAWLSEWLRTWRGALIVVTHDRRLLRHFDQFFIVAESGCRAFAGSFDELVADLERAEAEAARRYAHNLARLLDKEEHNARVRRRRQRKKNVGRIRELERCPSRIRLNGKRGYKQVSQATRALLQRDRITSMRQWAKSARRALSVSLPLETALPELPEPTAEPLVSLRRVSALANGRTLFSGLNLTLSRERIAVTGPNGSGKSTLLNIVLLERSPDAGAAAAALDRIGYIAQNAENWRRRESLRELLGTPTEAADVLAAHKFPFALAERPLHSLSPGERFRAALICLSQRRPAPELLVLDEPSDDLDLLATLALERVLRAWPGGLLLASHDAEFLESVGVEAEVRLGLPAPPALTSS